MRLGPFFLILLLVLIGFGYLLSDNLHLRRELAVSSQQQIEAIEQIQQLDQRRVSLEQELKNATSEQQQLAIGLQIKSIEFQILQQQQSLLQQGGEKLALSNRIMLTGYVEYNDTSLGRVVLTYPQSISLGNSEAVILTLIPNSVVYSASSKAIVDENTGTSSIELPGEIEISPIMTAKISGVGFDIVENVDEQAVNSDKPTEWVWTVLGKEEGRHILVANISIPISVDGKQEEVNANVHLYPVEIEVLKPLKSRLYALLPYMLPAVTTGIVSFFVGMLVNARQQKSNNSIMGAGGGKYVMLSKVERDAIIKMRRKL